MITDFCDDERPELPELPLLASRLGAPVDWDEPLVTATRALVVTT